MTQEIIVSAIRIVKFVYQTSNIDKNASDEALLKSIEEYASKLEGTYLVERSNGAGTWSRIGLINRHNPPATGLTLD